MILQNAGFKSISYTDSAKALQEFRPNYYDIVILDIRMPKVFAATMALSKTNTLFNSFVNYRQTNLKTRLSRLRIKTYVSFVSVYNNPVAYT